MNKILLLFLTIFLSFGRLSGQTGYYIPSERFSSSLISSLCQDKYGSIWIATDYGLNRFDGYHFEIFLHDDKNPSSICNSSAVSLLCDREGRVWVGTNRGLDRFDEASDGFVHYPFPEGIRPRVSDLLQLADGSILVATAGYGAFIVDREGRVSATDDYADKNNNQYFGYVYLDSKGRYWKTGYDNTVVMKTGGKVSLLQSKGEPVGIVERGTDELLVVGLRGIMAYRDGKLVDAGIDKQTERHDTSQLLKHLNFLFIC